MALIPNNSTILLGTHQEIECAYLQRALQHNAKHKPGTLEALELKMPNTSNM